MHRITFQMPFSSLIYAGLAILMGWGAFVVYQALGYLACPSWTAISPAPKELSAFLGILKGRLYLRAEDGSTWCLQEEIWAGCSFPDISYLTLHRPSPGVMPLFTAFSHHAAIRQMTYGMAFPQVALYLLRTDGQVEMCVTDWIQQNRWILGSAWLVLLVIPLAIAAACIAAILRDFIQHGSPTLWDFSGRGIKIR